MLLIAAAPWSLALVALAVPRARAALRGLLLEPWLALGGFAVAWTVLLLAFSPGAEPRQAIPALPAAAALLAALLGGSTGRSSGPGRGSRSRPRGRCSCC